MPPARPTLTASRSPKGSLPVGGDGERRVSRKRTTRTAATSIATAHPPVIPALTTLTLLQAIQKELGVLDVEHLDPREASLGRVAVRERSDADDREAGDVHVV